MLSSEVSVAQKNIHAQPGKALYRIIRRNLCPHSADEPHHVGKLYCWWRRFDSELMRFGHRIGRPGRANQCLRGHASIVEAIAAREMAFDQCYSSAQYRCSGRRHQSCRSGAHNYKVVAACRLGINPVRRVSILYEFFVEFICGIHLNCMRWRHCRLPPQLEPAPAVQPKQWLPVAIDFSASSVKDSISQTVFPPGVSRSSIWLKSQSQILPSHPMLTRSRHINPSTVAGL